jgi:hypothetical protein
VRRFAVSASQGSPSLPTPWGAQGDGGPLLDFPAYPAGFRGSDFASPPGFERFLPVAEAAEAMGRTETETKRLAAAGMLRARLVGDVLYVRPAVLSLAEVRP